MVNSYVRFHWFTPFKNKDCDSLRASWRLRSAFFRVWDLKSGQNSGLIVWKTVTVPLEGKHSKIVHRFNYCFHRCLACVLRYPRSSFSHPSVFMCVLRYPRSSFSQTSCFIHLQMRTIRYEISEVVTAGNIIRHWGIEVLMLLVLFGLCVLNY